MTISKITIAIAAVSLFAVAPAFAQTSEGAMKSGSSMSGTAGAGTSGDMAAPGQAPATAGAPMKGANTMMKSGNGTMTKTPTTGSTGLETSESKGAMPGKN